MNYEVWHTTTDACLGTLEVGNPIEHTIGARVVVRLKRPMFHDKLGRFDAIEMKVCRFRNKDKTHYYALETNMPLAYMNNLEGFTPKIITANAGQIYYFGKPQ